MGKKGPTIRNWPLEKNLHFLSNLCETWWKQLSNEVIIFDFFTFARFDISTVPWHFQQWDQAKLCNLYCALPPSFKNPVIFLPPFFIMFSCEKQLLFSRICNISQRKVLTFHFCIEFVWPKKLVSAMPLLRRNLP